MKKYMRHVFGSSGVGLSQLIVLAIGFPIAADAQAPNRLAAGIDSSKMVRLTGSQDSRIVNWTDQGPVEPSTPVHGLSFRFKPLAAQSNALNRLLEDQQDPHSPLYHAWLTPEEFGDRFGLSTSDLGKVTEWVRAQGFRVDYVSRSRTWILFSGTAGQVQNTFRTELHRYGTGGKTHFANETDVQIPAELEPLVYPISGLNDFRSHSSSPKKPRFNTSTGDHGVEPVDLAVIYDVKPLYEMGINGTGQKIVVIGQSRFKMSDVQEFRSRFGLPKNDPQTILVPGFPDPGITEEDYIEATLDVEYAGGTAPNATILHVLSPHVEASEAYAVDQNLAPVISDSYSICELIVAAHPGKTEEYRGVVQQAVAQGMTWINDSDDTGPAGCELQDRDKAGVSGISPNMPASLPEVTGVGGTTFNEGSGKYWNEDVHGFNPSALSYIPEVAWNDTGYDGTLAVSGGGASLLFPKPSWQRGLGVPNDNRRHVPDVAFTASWHHDFYFIEVDGGFLKSGGTSASTPFFAGVVALLNQYLVSQGIERRPGLGNINPKLYQLAQTTSGVFHDITQGDSIIPCQLGTPDCTTGQYGFVAGPGYDEVTGLGSIDVYNLFRNWAGTNTPPPSSSALALSSVPSVLVKNPKPDEGCTADYPFFQQLIVEERDGQEMQLTRFTVNSEDYSDDILDWFGNLRLAPHGHLFADICWQFDNVPYQMDIDMEGVDKEGHKAAAKLQVQVKVAGQPPGTLSVSKKSISLSASGSGSASDSLGITVPQGESWKISLFGDNHKSTWLTVSPQSGQGPGQVTLTASAAGLPNGVYTAALVLESVYSLPPFVEMPVTFTVGGSEKTEITAVQNAASFQQVFAPGMIMSVYGKGLANSNQSADSAPLPHSLAGVSATVDGIPAPLYFVSTGQINLQIPYEIPTGNAILAVDNNGHVGSYTFKVKETAPGIFNNAGAITPVASAKRGSTVSMYITGEGELAPMIDTGSIPAANTPVTQLPKPLASVKVTVGGVEANVVFAGNPWLVGIAQVNFEVPMGAPLGMQPVVVTVGRVSSAPEILKVQ